jgi:methanogenic corrinoid protein MtbC1
MNPIHRQVSEAILAGSAAIAEAVVSRELALHPELEQRYGPRVREQSLQDAGYHLAFLAAAVRSENPAVFAHYLAWAKIVLVKRGVLTADLAFHLECMKEVLHQRLPASPRALACDVIDGGLQGLPSMPDDVPSFLVEDRPFAALAREYLQSLLLGERGRASALILDAVHSGTAVPELYLHVFQPSQYEIGRLWQTNQISVAQEHYCTAVTQLVMSQLYPYLFATEKRARVLVATCVADEMHEVGVRMVADLFEMEGWTTYYLGANMPSPSVLRMVTERNADVLAISATLVYHVRAIEALIDAVRNAPACRGVKVLVGGQPFNLAPELAQRIGADGCGRDAQEAIGLANRLTA